MKQEKLYDRTLLKVEKIGEGSYGTVYKTCFIEEKEKPESERNYFVVKKMESKHFEEGINFSALREIKILKEIKHDNIVKLYDVLFDQSNLLITYELLDMDLHKLIYNQNNLILSQGIIKALMKQILLGLAETHKHLVIHRDLKPQNILLNKNGLVKLADYGMARYIASYERGMTKNLVTNWYRPPEIFFGASNYSFSVDIWSAGCIFGEIILKEPLFASDGDIGILTKIFYLLGIPNESTWPGATEMINYKHFMKGDVLGIKNKFGFESKEAIDLLEKMFALNPLERISVFDALKHEYFSVEPLPVDNNEISRLVKVVLGR